MNNEVAMINLHRMDSIKEALEEGNFTNEKAKANGIAILFSEESKSRVSMQTELMHFSIDQLASSIKSLENVSEHNSKGEIDPELKDFVYQTLMFNQWLFNSHCFRSGDLKEFQDFDKIFQGVYSSI